jgi:transposase
MPGTRSDDDQASLESILAASAEPAAHTGHLRSRAKLMTARGGPDLDRWIAVGGEPAPQSFGTGLRVDGDAVTAGFTLCWSSGSARAASTSSRCSKRQMDGCAHPDMLRRVFLSE